MARVERLYINETEVARMLGHEIAWLRTNAATLERQYGFPKVDPATGKRHRPSIEAWAHERNSRARLDQPQETTSQVKYHEL